MPDSPPTYTHLESSTLLHLLSVHRRSLADLEERAAKFGLHRPVDLMHELHDRRESIDAITAELAQRGVLPPPRVPRVSSTTGDAGAIMSRGDDRQTLIQLVTTLLQQSDDTHERAVTLALDLMQVPKLVAAAHIVHWGGSTAARPLTEPLTAFFLQVRRLLVVGQPGAGKSTTLRTLCRDLLALAREGTLPVPVIVNLASYGQQGGDILVWLARQGLKESLGVASAIAQQVLDRGLVLVLLDGLDEMAPARRSECIQALNRVIDSGHPSGHWLVVGCRLAEYQEAGIRLGAQTAIELQPLSATMVLQALAETDQTTAGLRAALQDTPHVATLLTVPLMLNLAAKAYTGYPTIAIDQTPTASLSLLYGDYTRRMLDRGRGRTGYPPYQTLVWLRWLARQMQREAMSILLVERLQIAWLDARRAFGLISGGCVGMVIWLVVELVLMAGGLIGGWMGTGLTSGPAGGMLFGLIAALVYVAAPHRLTPVERLGWKMHPRHYYRVSVLLVGLVGAGIGLLMGWIGSVMASSLVIGIGAALAGGASYAIFPQHRIKPVERLHWTPRHLRHHRASMLLVGGVFGLLTAWMYGLTYGPLLGLGTALGSGLIVGLNSGWIAVMRDEPDAPNAGIWASLRNGSIQAGWNALLNGLVFGLCFGLLGGVSVGVVVGGMCGLVGGLVGGLDGGWGEALKHGLLRLLLWHEGHAPLRYVRFLESCRGLLLLRRRGGAYEFWHITLRDYLATLTDDDIIRLARSPDE